MYAIIFFNVLEKIVYGSYNDEHKNYYLRLAASAESSVHKFIPECEGNEGQRITRRTLWHMLHNLFHI